MKNSFDGICCSYDPDIKTSPTGFTWKQLAEYRENNYREVLRFKGIENPTFEQLLVWDGYPEPYSKYKRMLSLNISQNHFIAFDVETANTRRDSICSIGIVEVKNSEIVSKNHWYIRPEPLDVKPINYSKHQISKNFLKDKPTFSEVWHEIEPFFKVNHVVAHNLAFDKNCVSEYPEFRDILPNIQFACTLKLSRKAYELNNYQLQTVCSHIEHDLGIHHDALADAIGCAMIYIDLLENEEEQEEQIESIKKIKYKQWAGKNISIEDIKLNTLEQSKILSKYHFVFTGELESMTRANAMKEVISLGADVKNKMSGSITHLVVGGDSKNTAKYIEAIRLGIEILDEDDFLQLLDKN